MNTALNVSFAMDKPPVGEESDLKWKYANNGESDWSGRIECMDTAKTADLSAYTDSASISARAVDAMQWANAEGLILGRTETTLVPQGETARAETAAILMRFMET